MGSSIEAEKSSYESIALANESGHQREDGDAPAECDLEVESHDGEYRKMATLLVILCLINTVIYIRIFCSLLLTKPEQKKDDPSSGAHPIFLAFLFGAILIELLGLVAVLCRSRLLLLVYGVSMVVALVSLLFLLLSDTFGGLSLLFTVVNVFAVWRTYYFLVSRDERPRTSRRWRDCSSCLPMI